MGDIPEGMLVVDHRENEKVIHELIMRLGDAKTDPNGKVWVCQLKTGDYIIGDWIIEAKEINDLAGSITGIGRSRTVAAQLRDMEESNQDKVPWLVVYGETKDLKPWVPKKGQRNMKQAKVVAKARQKGTISAFKKGFCIRFPHIRYFHLEDIKGFVEWLVETYKQKIMLN